MHFSSSPRHVVNTGEKMDLHFLEQLHFIVARPTCCRMIATTQYGEHEMQGPSFKKKNKKPSCPTFTVSLQLVIYANKLRGQSSEEVDE